jgi:hypothetical protein
MESINIKTDQLLKETIKTINEKVRLKLLIKMETHTKGLF